jgi:hypothetical protein
MQVLCHGTSLLNRLTGDSILHTMHPFQSPNTEDAVLDMSILHTYS